MMYYHVVIKYKDSKKKFEPKTDLTDIDDIKHSLILPYLRNQNTIFCGISLCFDEVEQVSVYMSEKDIDKIERYLISCRPNTPGVTVIYPIDYYSFGTKFNPDITSNLIQECKPIVEEEIRLKKEKEASKKWWRNFWKILIGCVCGLFAIYSFVCMTDLIDSCNIYNHIDIESKAAQFIISIIPSLVPLIEILKYFKKNG